MLRRASLTVLALVLMPATVHAFDHHNDHDADDEGDSGGGCSSSSSHGSTSPASGGTVTAQPPTANPGLSSDNKHVFVTSTTFSGALGGLDAADMYCQSAATAGGLTGTFHAWISYGSSNAFDRTSDVGPWYTTRDAVAFASKADLRGTPQSALLDETGGYPQTLAGAWTGSDAQGAATSENCDGWTNATAGAAATTGTGSSDDAAWGGGNSSIPCNAKAPLICFQQ
jgi:hypothetical protein